MLLIVLVVSWAERNVLKKVSFSQSWFALDV